MRAKVKALAAILAYSICLLLVGCTNENNPSSQNQDEKFSHTSYAMSTLITQTAYGPNAQQAMSEVSARLLTLEQELSMFDAESYVAAINANAGKEYIQVPKEVYEIIKISTEFSPQSQGAFCVTIAPVTLAWGITTSQPRFVPEQERAGLLLLVNDQDVLFDEANSAIMLKNEGQGIDLGGIAKGWACSFAKEIYEKNNVTRGTLSIGGNIYVHGDKPDGTPFKIGFRNPEENQQAYMASFSMAEKVIAVSGGYERFVEIDGVKYEHIIDPQTGAPVISDIASVGVIHQDGAYADFMSTTLYVWGLEKTIEFMQTNTNCEVILLDTENNIVYVSKSLEGNFVLYDSNEIDFQVEFI